MRYIIVILLFVMQIGSLCSQQFEFRNVETDLDTPWEILWGPDDNIWMTERYGRISRVNPETGEVTELAVLDEVFEDGERGLMGMVLHPDFDTNPYVYTVFTYRTTDGGTLIKLVRFTYDGSSLSEPYTLIDSIRGAWNHDGSRLIIDEDKTLYMTMGDAATASTAQDINSLNGKVLRMNLDGSIPEDNPLPNSYVWSYGHRNPQGLVKANGILYSSEHGPSTDDEVNIIEKGRNFGWPQVNGFCDKPSEMDFCDENNVKEPIAAWTPTLAVAGLDYYGDNYIPAWNNSLLLVVLKSSRLVQMKLSEDGKTVEEENHFFTNQFGRLRDVCISPDGRVFISTSNKDGRGSPADVDDRIIELLPSGVDVDDMQYDSGFEIYPNPMEDKLKIRMNDNQTAKIEIRDIYGEIILSDEFNTFFEWHGRDEYNDLVSNGVYIVAVKNSDKTSFKKVLILR